ncbi:response regulator [Flaviaesturariibacter flavus]|uniref:Response regulator n=1 Tax=Flaviaesturariibacter flavus TaxID=2502780 RepID=A0A4R1BJE1_9BACT|nr:response regulator [Flaviaesturariibacter flavus]TCJ17443.1 response regulator [Flaviaesturariibacter flavus]
MMKAYEIWIVDDDADDREILRDAFTGSRAGDEYLFLENGDALMAALEGRESEKLPSLIMLDLNMPGKDGREALREIKGREEFHGVPIVVFTTSSSDRDRNHCYRLGANCFVTKPDTFNKLVELAGHVQALWLPV